MCGGTGPRRLGSSGDRVARRRVVVEPPAPLAPPVELAGGCIVEDWVTVDEGLPVWWGHGDLVRTMEEYRVVAWSRWRRARMAWLAERVVPRERWGRACPSCRPRFRDYEAFVERLKGRAG